VKVVKHTQAHTHSILGKSEQIVGVHVCSEPFYVNNFVGPKRSVSSLCSSLTTRQHNDDADDDAIAPK